MKSMDEYQALYKKSIENPQEFWQSVVDQFYFHSSQPEGKPFVSYNFNINEGPISIKWLEGAKTNVCYNMLDHNIKKKGLGDNIAFYW